MAVMVGGVLAGFTVKAKLVEVVRVPSLTVTVIVALPLWPDAGVIITFRPAPFPPPKVISASGTRVVFEDVPDRVKPLG